MLPENCERCGKTPLGVSITSMFNTETICMPCKEREKRHPRYAEATRIETEAVLRGEYDFPGVGCPADLYQPLKEVET